MPSILLTILLAATILPSPDGGSAEQSETEGASPETTVAQPTTYDTPRALLNALAEKDARTTTLVGDVRYTVIRALENDRQMRLGRLAIKNGDNPDSSNGRKYAVRFDTLRIDQRQEEIDEHFIFDGRWFVERYPEEKQFNKRELVPAGETLDPMELMRDAPFWVSLGRDQDRLLQSYHAELRPTGDGLLENLDFPELRFLAELPHIAGTTQLMLTPKQGSGFEDDWEYVRIWVDTETRLPAMYIKQDWTGDLQIVELFETQTNTDIPASVFDTTAPDARTGWRVQISNWRSDDNAERSD